MRWPGVVHDHPTDMSAFLIEHKVGLQVSVS